MDGRVRIYGVPTTVGLPDSREGAEQTERDHIARVLKTGEVTQTPPDWRQLLCSRIASHDLLLGGGCCLTRIATAAGSGRHRGMAGRDVAAAACRILGDGPR